MNKNALLKHLAADDLSDAARDAVLDAGTAAIPALLQVLRDPEQWGEDEDGEGSAALHAAALLGDLKAVAAVEPMLDMLQELEPFGELAQCIVEALGHMGAAVVEPTLKRVTDLDEEEDGFDYLDVLSRCGVKDARVYKLLTAAFKEFPGEVSSLLGHYGDAAALPLLVKTLDGMRLSDGKAALEPALDCTELAHAIVALGGELTDAQKEKLEVAAQAVLDASQLENAEEAVKANVQKLVSEDAGVTDQGGHTPHVHGPNCSHDHHGHDHAPQEPRVRSREKLGRNDPCWCDSGKKYKKCHYEADQRALY